MRPTFAIAGLICTASILYLSFAGGRTASHSEASPVASSFAPATWQRGQANKPVSSHAKGGFFEHLRTWGFEPEIILDVGANEGNWAREIWNYFGDFPGRRNCTVLMVEGSNHRVGSLSGTGFDFVISVVGEQTKEVEFYSSEAAHTGNSVLRENTGHFDNVVPIKTVMRTLDELIAEYTRTHPSGPRRVNLLKLDVQGYELEVLKGAKQILADVEVIVLETSVLQFNVGSPLTGEILGTLHQLGYQVIDVLEMHHAGPQKLLFQIDFAFIKRGSPLIAKANEGAAIKNTP